MPPLSKHPPPSLTHQFLHWYFPLCKQLISKHLLGTLLVNFWFSFIVNCVCKHVHTKLLYSLVHWSLPSFLLFTLKNDLTQDCPLSPLMTQVASMPLGLVLTQLVHVHESYISSSVITVKYAPFFTYHFEAKY